MHVNNLRFGFATNSSSTHSVIFLGQGVDRADIPACGDHEFGWEYFALHSEEAKMRYLTQAIIGNLKGIPRWMRERVASQITGTAPEGEGYIDHQSMPLLPASWEGTGLDVDFLRGMRELFATSGVAVFGGNDNDETYYKGPGDPLLDTLPYDGCSGDRSPWVCRRDQDGWWVLFNRQTGTKLTVSLQTQPAERTRPQAPELVDVKITDYCPFNCPYCYQASTEDGIHCEAQDLHQFAVWCKDNKVFEVALGGGEPTLHPKFLDILEYFRWNGVVPNFTTRNLAWLRDEEFRPKILGLAGAFAVSISGPREVEKLVALLERHQVDPGRVNLHVVMGTLDQWDFESILYSAHERRLRVILLGFKRSGFGAKYKMKPYGWWLDVLGGMKRLPSLGIDTALASESQARLDQLKIPHQLYYTEEGRHSFYVDAVNGNYGASSYGELRPLESTQSADKYMWAWQSLA